MRKAKLEADAKGKLAADAKPWPKLMPKPKQMLTPIAEASNQSADEKCKTMDNVANALENEGATKNARHRQLSR
jgi:hypothetical protein